MRRYHIARAFKTVFESLWVQFFRQPGPYLLSSIVMETILSEPATYYSSNFDTSRCPIQVLPVAYFPNRERHDDKIDVGAGSTVSDERNITASLILPRLVANRSRILFLSSAILAVETKSKQHVVGLGFFGLTMLLGWTITTLFRYLSAVSLLSFSDVDLALNMCHNIIEVARGIESERHRGVSNCIFLYCKRKFCKRKRTSLWLIRERRMSFFGCQCEEGKGSTRALARGSNDVGAKRLDSSDT
ncbi:hypothetical protein C8J56DRAFT_1027925 [Mycena floridula]|nr:hypothetical protein C8J56DRAFT_1027925 [Mycena floridula]